MNENITLYSNADLTTLARNNDDTEVIDEPSDELTGAYQYSVARAAFEEAYKNWDHDAHPLLTLHDSLSHVDIFIGRPNARRIREALDKKQESVQLL